MSHFWSFLRLTTYLGPLPTIYQSICTDSNRNSYSVWKARKGKGFSLLWKRLDPHLHIYNLRFGKKEGCAEKARWWAGFTFYVVISRQARDWRASWTRMGLKRPFRVGHWNWEHLHKSEEKSLLFDQIDFIWPPWLLWSSTILGLTVPSSGSGLSSSCSIFLFPMSCHFPLLLHTKKVLSKEDFSSVFS